MVNGGLKRICKTGETVLEEVLFLEKNKKISLEKCKVMSETFLLEIDLDKYRKMREEMVYHGFKG